ncbi:MAG: riboflavin biosynthesis protein RibD [Candidatus Kapaibacterium sp.]|nr:MAG: riboflavin biosynthesis protein RibD [Candidatus Kapabacteria bacterium]
MTEYQAMGRALELALRGTGKVSPNPRVGCVILRDGEIIAEGWHDHFGGMHAEVHALTSARSSLDGATLVVTLEPCAHHGKQPPCTDAIIATKRRPDGTLDPERGIRRVVIGMRDPNPAAGGGLEKLQQAGIEVTVGVREQECWWLNRFFVKHVTTGKPYVIGKAAISLDGCIATRDGASVWISGEESRRRSHALRAEVDAVLVGRGTVQRDDPHLGPRLVRGKMPRRIVLDTHLRLAPTHRVFSDSHRMRTVVCTSPQAAVTSTAELLKRRGVMVLPVPLDEKGRLSLAAVFDVLGEELLVSSVLVEGGQEVLSGCVADGLLDELHLFVAPMLLGAGIGAFGRLAVESLSAAPRWHYHAISRAGDDLHIVLFPQRSSA